MNVPHITKTAQAERDLDDIWFYIAVDNSVAADALLDSIDKQLHLLAEQPMIGRARPELAASLRSLAIERYVVFYMPSVNGIEVIRVLHSARDMGEMFHE